MDDLQIARATALIDIFGSSDSGSSSYENLSCENNTISLVDEITSLNVVQKQDLNLSSHHLPAVGMLFDNIDELLTAYQDYVKEKGFVVAIRYSVRDTNASSQFKYVSISCDRGRNTYFEKRSKRINCPAKVCAVRQGDNCWPVSKVVVEHNHGLILNLSSFMRGHRKMSMHMKHQLDANDIAGIRPFKSIRMLQVQSGGPENLGYEYKKFQEIECALHEAVDLCKNNPASLGFLKREMDALIEKIRSDLTYVRCRGRPRVNRFISVRERGNNSQGRRNGLRHGRQSRHGGRRVINSVTIHNSGEVPSPHRRPRSSVDEDDESSQPRKHQKHIPKMSLEDDISHLLHNCSLNKEEFDEVEISKELRHEDAEICKQSLLGTLDSF
ncbi:hypothetical protein Syun_018940 [Stephania yunnanensis]|uniref:FAR1 domain-containing protein n=1 Tax=Stephania yunnanensis TaxID=152371 RepID=A0AAP0IUT3_9MAGN